MANDLALAEFHRVFFWARWIADIHYRAPCSIYKSYSTRFIAPIYPKNVRIIVWSTLILLHAIEVRIRKFRRECRFDPCNLRDDLKKTIGHLLYATSSFVHHFKAIAEVKRMLLSAIGDFKLELQSGNAKFLSKSANFCPVWSWNIADDFDKQ